MYVGKVASSPSSASRHRPRPRPLRNRFELDGTGNCAVWGGDLRPSDIRLIVVLFGGVPQMGTGRQENEGVSRPPPPNEKPETGGDLTAETDGLDSSQNVGLVTDALPWYGRFLLSQPIPRHCYEVTVLLRHGRRATSWPPTGQQCLVARRVDGR